MRFLSSLSVLFAIVACSSGGDQPCTLIAIGAECQKDTDCCSGFCMLEGNASYCQAKPAVMPACEGPTAFCTQDRNCCSNFCQGNQCFGGGVTTSCVSLGSACTQPTSCCSVNCVPDGNGGMACAPQPQPDGGLSCGLPGASCTLPGAQDPTCCFGVCGSNGQCAGGSTGGNNPNCGGSGAYCKYGADCCSNVCEQVSNGFQCK